MPDHVLHDDDETQSRLTRLRNGITSFITHPFSTSAPAASPKSARGLQADGSAGRENQAHMQRALRSKTQSNTQSVPRLLQGTFDEGVEIISDEEVLHANAAGRPGTVHRRKSVVRDTSKPQQQRGVLQPIAPGVDQEFCAAPRDVVVVDNDVEPLLMLEDRPKMFKSRMKSFRPVNTLDKSRSLSNVANTKSRFMARSTGRLDGQDNLAVLDKSHKMTVGTSRTRISHDEPPPPCKKARTGQSPKDPPKRTSPQTGTGDNRRIDCTDAESPDPLTSKQSPMQSFNYGRYVRRKASGGKAATLFESAESKKTSPIPSNFESDGSYDDLFGEVMPRTTQQAQNDKTHTSSSIFLPGPPFDHPERVHASGIGPLERPLESRTEEGVVARQMEKRSGSDRPATASGYNEQAFDDLQVITRDNQPQRRPILHDLEKTGASHRTYLSSTSPKTPVRHTKQKPRQNSIYRLKSFCFNDIPSFPDAALFCDKKNKMLRLVYPDAQLPGYLDGNLPISAITKAERTDSNDAAIVVFYCSTNIIAQNKCGFEFESPRDLVSLMLDIENLGTGIRQPPPRSPEKMLKIITGLHHESKTHHPTVKHAFETMHASPPRTTTKPSRSKPDFAKQPRTLDLGVVLTVTPNTEVADRSTPVPMPPPRNDQSRNLRSTRSSTSALETSQAAPATNSTRRQGTPWKRPLVYPKDGKSPESITWDDLSYLEDGQMLNETSIAVFLRYLRENIDPQQMKRIHFFSTFFYSSLTKPPPGGWPDKSSKVNYNAVARWTKNINLFSRDYVVVPIHEAAHFYVMIICNLPALKDASLSDGEHDAEEVEDIVMDHPSESDATLIKSDFPSTGDPGLVSELSSGRKPGRRKKTAPVRRYDPQRPIIITLDSLSIPRSQTASILKQYLVKEAKDKHDLDISVTDIKAMTAAKIPRQPNYCDCGLYTCVYIEQFMADPEIFKRTILQPLGFDPAYGIRWPPDSEIKSENLRQSLYDMLQALYKSYKEGRPPQIPPVGQILIPAAPEPVASGLAEQFKQGINAYRRYDADRQQRRLTGVREQVNDFSLHVDGDESRNLVEVIERPLVRVGKSKQNADSTRHLELLEGDVISKYFVPDGADRVECVPIQVPDNLATEPREEPSPFQQFSKGSHKHKHDNTKTRVDLTSPITRHRVRSSTDRTIPLSQPLVIEQRLRKLQGRSRTNEQAGSDASVIELSEEASEQSEYAQQDREYIGDNSSVHHNMQDEPWEGFSVTGDHDTSMDDVEVADSQDEAQVEVDPDDDMIMKD